MSKYLLTGDGRRLFTGGRAGALCNVKAVLHVL